MSDLKVDNQQESSSKETDPISLQEQFQMKSLIMAKWAHELKNIFLAISSLVQNQNESSIYPDNIENIKMNQVTSQHKAKFLSSLCDLGMYLIFDITTLNTNNETMKERQESISEFNLSEALDFCIAMFQSKQKFDPSKKNILIKSQYNFPLNKTIKCINENRFKQVIINLLSNSYKFTLNGEICLSCNYISNDRLKVQISDTGIGMKPEEQDRLFKPYNIIEQNKEINLHGSGLGLYIVKEILTSFGTNIHLRSTKNVGTEFWFELNETLSELNHSNSPLYDSHIDKNAIDPASIITETLKNMIFDINEGKKDDMVWLKTNSNANEHGEKSFPFFTIPQSNITHECNNNSPNLNNDNSYHKQNSNMVLSRLLSLSNNSYRNIKGNIVNTNDKSSYPSSSKYLNLDSDFNYYHSIKNKQEDNCNSNNKCSIDDPDNQSKKSIIIKTDSKSNIKTANDMIKDSGIEYGRSLSQYPQQLKSKQMFSKKTKKYNIFICDDEQITAISTKNLLIKYFKTETNYLMIPEMYIIPNGIECLYKAYKFLLEENPVNLILIDHNMPFLNGIEVCNLIKNMTEMNNIKLYLVSSEDGQKTKYNAKVDGYFSKPITKNNIREIFKNNKMC